MSFFIVALMSSALAQDFTLDKESGKAIPNFIGEIKLLKGSAFKTQSQDRPQGLKVGARLYQGDTLQTAESSFVRVSMVDKSTINLGPSSTLNFATFNFKDEFNRQSTYDFIGGQMRALIKNKAAPDEIKFKVKDAVMGIRGTEILINRREIEGLNVSEFALIEGKATVDHVQGETALEAGEHLVIVENPASNLKRAEEIELNAGDLKSLQQEGSVLEYFEPAAHPSFKGLMVKHIPATATPATSGTSQERSRGTLKNLELLNEEMRQTHKKKNGL